jgi:hypothetical protein
VAVLVDIGHQYKENYQEGEHLLNLHLVLLLVVMLLLLVQEVLCGILGGGVKILHLVA